jgi:hypothetical protein
MSNEYVTRKTGITVMPKGEQIFSIKSTHVSIDDEGGGEFVRISQTADTDTYITLDPEEWPAVKAAVDELIKEVRCNICDDHPHHDLCCCNECTPDNQPPQPQEDSNNV